MIIKRYAVVYEGGLEDYIEFIGTKKECDDWIKVHPEEDVNIKYYDRIKKKRKVNKK